MTGTSFVTMIWKYNSPSVRDLDVRQIIHTKSIQISDNCDFLTANYDFGGYPITPYLVWLTLLQRKFEFLAMRCLIFDFNQFSDQVAPLSHKLHNHKWGYSYCPKRKISCMFRCWKVIGDWGCVFHCHWWCNQQHWLAYPKPANISKSTADYFYHTISYCF